MTDIILTFAYVFPLTNDPVKEIEYFALLARSLCMNDAAARWRDAAELN